MVYELLCVCIMLCQLKSGIHEQLNGNRKQNQSLSLQGDIINHHLHLNLAFKAEIFFLAKSSLTDITPFFVSPSTVPATLAISGYTAGPNGSFLQPMLVECHHNFGLYEPCPELNLVEVFYD